MFCKRCGTELQAGGSFCSSCGAKTDAIWPDAKQAPRSSQSSPSSPSAARQSLKNKLMDWVLLAVSVLVILLGIGYLGLAVAGRTVTAQVTDYEQVLFINNDNSTRNPSRYKLEYSFAVNGQRYTGSVTRVFPNGSHMRQTISVRYLPFWPSVNAEEKDVDPAGPVTLGAGVLLLAYTIRKKVRNSAAHNIS